MKLKIVTAFVISYFILTPQGHALELEDYFPINDKNGWSYQSTGLDPVSFDKTIFTYISGQERVDYQNGHQPVGPRIYYDIELGKPDTQESYDVMRFDQNIYGGLTLMKSVDDNEYTLYGANIDPCCGPPANFSPSKPVVLAPLTFNIGDVYVVDNGLPPSSLSAGPGFVEYTYDDRGTTDRTDDLLIGERRSTMKFTFESIEPEVTVQAGTFYDVLKIKQEETASEPAFLNNPDVKATTTSYLYLAKDVGRIMEVSNEEVTTFLPGTNTVDTVTQRSRTDELINYKLSYQDVDQLVLIDWENPISARFGQKSMYDPNTGKTVWDYTLNPDIGNLPQNVVVDLDDKAEILNELRQIFRDSGMEKISIVDSHTYRLADENLPSDALSVRFGSRTTIDKTDLLGIALDIGNGVDFDDIHNERKDGEVAVFLDNDFSNKYIAELIAHEVGHGLGLRHINAFIPPEENASREVMDYQSGPGREEFTNLPAIIQEPPIDPGADPIANLPLTHNPIYHLNQYTLGQTISTWKGEVVTPGTYDTIAVEDYYSLFGLNINPNQSIYDVTVRVNREGLGGSWQSVYGLPELSIDDLMLLELSVPKNLPVQVWASSAENSEDWDLLLGYGDITNPDFNLFPGGRREGNIFRYLSDSQTYEIYGNFLLADLTDDGGNGGSGGTGSNAVPEPMTLALFGSGLLGAVITRRKRSGDV